VVTFEEWWFLGNRRYKQDVKGYEIGKKKERRWMKEVQNNGIIFGLG
jgi:hypothetical protein